MKSTFLLLVLLALCLQSMAQRDRSASARRNQWSLDAEELYTTHDDFFHGVYVSRKWALSDRVWLGPEVGFTGAPEHTDNGWYLTKLRFLPVAMVADWYPRGGRNGGLFLEAGAGPSFNTYRKLEDPIASSFRVRETGLYARVAAGYAVQLQKQVRLFFSVGMKGYHISTNVWDVNPHGICAGLGAVFLPHHS